MKQIVRAFSLGLLTATIILAVAYLIRSEATPETIEVQQSTEEMVAELEQEGYYIFDHDPTEKVDETSEFEQEDNSVEDETPSVDEDNDQTSEETISDNTYLLTIEPGMTVSQVAEYLVAANIIDQRDQIINYLIDNDYGTNIQIGEFELNRDMSVEEVVAIIANQN